MLFRSGRCRSGAGLLDMIGNVAEYTADGMVRGGDATSNGQTAGCGLSRKAPAEGGTKLVGFRCCAAPTLGEATP